MVKMQAAVEGGVIDSSINSPLGQKISLKLKNNHKNSKKAFSVAEAMIALLIGSVALGMAAPMITKQIKAQNMSDAQVRVVNQRLADIMEDNAGFRQEIEEIIEERIREIREESASIPSGMVAFFNTTSCPEGWSAINSEWNGRFPRFAGSYTVLSYNTLTQKLNATGTVQTLNVGATQEDAIRNIYGVVGSLYGGTITNQSGSLRTGAFTPHNRTYTKFGGLGLISGGDSIWNVSFEAKNVVPTDIENRPRTVALLGCVKN